MASFSKTLKDLTPKQICIVMLISGWLLATVYPPFDLLDTFRGLFGKERFGTHSRDHRDSHSDEEKNWQTECPRKSRNGCPKTKKWAMTGNGVWGKVSACKWSGGKKKGLALQLRDLAENFHRVGVLGSGRAIAKMVVGMRGEIRGSKNIKKKSKLFKD